MDNGVTLEATAWPAGSGGGAYFSVEVNIPRTGRVTIFMSPEQLDDLAARIEAVRVPVAEEAVAEEVGR